MWIKNKELIVKAATNGYWRISVCFCVCVYNCVCVCVCVGQCTHHPESSVGKGMVHSSCVQVSWLDLFIYIHLHAVKRSRCWQPPEPTVFLDPGPILSAWLHGTAKRGTAGSQPGRSAPMKASGRHLSADRHQLTPITSKCHWGRTWNTGVQVCSYPAMQKCRGPFSAILYHRLN